MVEDKKVCTPAFLASSVCPVPCTPNCSGKECGDDGCGGQCGNCGVYGCLKGKCVSEFIDLGDGTIKAPGTKGEYGTNLIWQKYPSEKIYSTNVEAGDYCATLKLAGKDDWFLPSFEELNSLLLSQPMGKCYIHPVFQVPDPNWPEGSSACDWFWSSSPDNNYCPQLPEFPIMATLVINFGEGYTGTNCCANVCYSDRVRCVRYEFTNPLP